ncbi:MAG: PHP-associated domain-containing protein [Patescibacteria group bacterium]|nr:hypothetical protein [Patescibacteria group bacterium]
MIRVDYHFHPNLPLLNKTLSKKKACAIWRELGRNDLDVVVVTEHNYKNPKTQFELLESQKPKNTKTTIFPGLEFLTKEGVDTIVFTKDKKDIYSKKKLLEPRSLNMEELIDYVKKDKKLHAIVTHPCTPGMTSILRKCGRPTTLNALHAFGKIEVHNCALDVLEVIIRKPLLNKIFCKKHSQIKDTQNAPSDLIVDGVQRTGGSDAHQIGEIGSCMEINEKYVSDKDKLFDIITSKSGTFHRKEKPPSTLVIGIGTTFKEWMIKKARLYTIDKPLASLYLFDKLRKNI